MPWGAFLWRVQSQTSKFPYISPAPVRGGGGGGGGGGGLHIDSCINPCSQITNFATQQTL